MYLFLCFTPLTCDVMYIGVCTYLHGRCFLSALYNDIICLMSPQSMLLFVFSDSSSHACATSQNSPPRIDQSHTSCRNTVCSLFSCACHCRGFPLEGQCCECFTSSQLSWDTGGLGLPLEMPLAVTFSSCEWMIIRRREFH